MSGSNRQSGRLDPHRKAHIYVTPVRQGLAAGLLAVMMISLLSGCASTEGDGSASGWKRGAADVTNYTVENRMEVLEINERGEQKKEGDSNIVVIGTNIVVKGLKDKKVEKLVNDQIQAKYQEVAAMPQPPYRGIRVEIPSGSTLEEVFINGSVTGNFNNILSLTITKNSSYRLPDSDPSEADNEAGENQMYRSCMEMETLNLDLNSGEEIELKDLFSEGVDYVQLLNGCVYDSLQKEGASEEGIFSLNGGNAKLVKPFETILRNQKFAISSEGIQLIIDYANPEFEIGFYPSIMTVSEKQLAGNLVMTQRFYDPNVDLYESKDPQIMKLRYDSFGQQDYEGKEELVTISGVRVDRELIYPKDMPQHLKVKAHRLFALTDAERGMITAYAKAGLKSLGDYAEGLWCEYRVQMTRVGGYTVLAKDLGMNSQNLSGNMRIRKVYDTSTGQEIQFSEIFKKNFDYLPILREKVEQELKSAGLNTELSVDQFLESMEFELGSTYLSLFAPIAADGAARLMQGEEKAAGRILPDTAVVYVPYEAFGCDNLNIFH